jgi:streptogramin lyase
MTRKWLWTLGIPVLVMLVASRVATAPRWLGPAEVLATTDGVTTEFPLPTPGSGPTTIALTQDGSVWFTESAGNRVGRMRPDGTGLAEFPLPNPNSGPRIIAVGGDGHLWFVELSGTMDGRRPDGNRVGRITMQGEITEFPLPPTAAGATGLTAGSDRQPPSRIGDRLWFTASANTLAYFQFK